MEEQELKKETRWKITEKDVFESIVHEQYHRMGAKTTACLLILNSGFEIVGTSAPIDAEIFDFATGKKFARERAVEKVWEYLGAVTQFEMAVAKQMEKKKQEEFEKLRDLEAKEDAAKSEHSLKEEPKKPAIAPASESA